MILDRSTILEPATRSQSTSSSPGKYGERLFLALCVLRDTIGRGLAIFEGFSSRLIPPVSWQAVISSVRVSMVWVTDEYFWVARTKTWTIIVHACLETFFLHRRLISFFSTQARLLRLRHLYRMLILASKVGFMDCTVRRGGLGCGR